MPILPLPVETMAWLLGVGLLVLFALVHALGGSALRPLGVAEAAAAYAEAHPEDAVHSVVLAEDGQSALLPAGAAVGLVFRLGRGTVVRRLDRTSLRRVSATPSGLRLDLRDPSCPRVVLRVSGAPDWAARLGALG